MRILLIVLLSVMCARPSIAEPERAASYEVVDKVQQAIALLRDDEEQALEALRDPNGEFVWKDTYVFVIDCDADIVISDPVFPERVGGDIKQHGDFAGYSYGEELCNVARFPVGGWVEYFWVPPDSETPVRKLSYVRSAGGTRYQVGAGVYDYSITEPRRYRELDGDA